MQTINRKIEATNVYFRNKDAKTRVVINRGGSGSSKSYSLCQNFILNRLLQRKNYKLLILRKTRASLFDSTYEMFIEMLKDYGIYNEDDHNKTRLVYRFPENNNYVLFSGLDKLEKKKSTEWHDIWVEEANEIDVKTYNFLKLRLYRGSSDIKSQLWLSFNPVECWIQDIENDKDVTLIKSTYRDNDFINSEAMDILQGLKGVDDTYYSIYANGEYAILKDIIYNLFIRLEKWIDEPENFFDDVIYGLDFGFNNQTALVEIGIKDGEFYIRELLYKSGLNNSDRIELAKQLTPELFKNKTIYADSSSPEFIQEFRDAGFDCKPAEKGKDSVKSGIDLLQRSKIHSLASNVNLEAERKSYKWREVNGKILDEPVKFKDHLLDALRYAIFTWSLSFGKKVDIKEVIKDLNKSRDMVTANQIW
jgi:phage terminase large subunit